MKKPHPTPRRQVTSRKRKSQELSAADVSVYPFSAIVGQTEMKLALILNVIDPSIGGVLIMGHRGTGKSTAVRGLADLLAEISVVAGCPYHCNPNDNTNLCADCKEKSASGTPLMHEVSRVPVIDLPLGATEDRVCGTIDIERALQDGKKTFEPGLLARANRGFLYIDEVNLLEDHLVDLLLDVAVTGRNRVEREGISIQHPALFVLIGSGNPEEGELRPQLLDRFGLHVAVRTENDLERRVEIVERMNLFTSGRASFVASMEEEQRRLRRRIARAQKSFAGVTVERMLLRQIAQLCSELKVDGHRGELTITRTARALAAFEGRGRVTQDDVRRVAVMSLRHRLRRDPLEETASSARIEQTLEKVFRQHQDSVRGRRGQDPEDDGPSTLDAVGEVKSGLPDRGKSATPAGEVAGDSAAELSLPAAIEAAIPRFKVERGWPGRRGHTKPIDQQHHQTFAKRLSNAQRGRYAKAVAKGGDGARVALDATLRAIAAKASRWRVSGGGQGTFLTSVTRHRTSWLSGTIRFKQFSRKTGSLFIIAIDTSGSMALNRIGQAKDAVIHLLRQSYLNRDRVALVAFRGTSGEIVLPESRSMVRARRVLDSLSVGGGTPLAAGLASALDIARRAQQKHSKVVLLLFTDGHANSSVRSSRTGTLTTCRQLIEREVARLGAELKKAGVSSVVIDTQNGYKSDGAAHIIAQAMNADYTQIKSGAHQRPIDRNLI